MLYASQNVTFITKVQDICIAMMQIITLFLVTAIIVDSHDNMKWQVKILLVTKITSGNCSK